LAADGSERKEDYLALDDRALLAQCEVDAVRGSGPGGQKRNKTSSSVRIRHLPTGLIGLAADSRSQHENRGRALSRLRQAIALNYRREVSLTGFVRSDILAGLFSRDGARRVGKRHVAYWAGVQQLLDLLIACRGSVRDCAANIGISTGALSRLILSEPSLLPVVNRYRETHDLRPLR
jgi:hypothetical protein